MTLLLAAFVSFSVVAVDPPADEKVGALSTNGVALADMSKVKVETVLEGLQVPWAIAWTGADRMLVNERPGRVRVATLKDGNWALREKPLYNVPDLKVRRGGEIGLEGLCVHPNYADNKFVYIAYGSSDNDVRVVRLKDTGDELIEPKVIIDKIPAAANHAGCRPAFGPDGKLYVTCGDSTNRKLAPDLKSIAGKTLRLNDDGTIPSDNPFVGKGDGVREEIFSYGHRNAQGIDWQPGSNLMFQSEHGPTGDGAPQGADEVNIVERGRDLGWPEAWGKKPKEGADGPIVLWEKATAPASGCFYKGEVIPALAGQFLVGCLGGLRSDPEPGIYAIKLAGRKVVGQERWATTFGRIREVAVGPDGWVYFSTSNKDGRGKAMEGDDRVMRMGRGK